MKQRKNDIDILYQGEAPGLFEALNQGVGDAYDMSLSLKRGLYCLTLSPKEQREMDRLCDTMASWVIERMQRATMEHWIETTLFDTQGQSVEVLTNLCMKNATRKGFCLGNKAYVETIVTRLQDCLQSPHINLEGFFTFRMRDILHDWAQCTNEVLQYLCARAEYETSVEMLSGVYENRLDHKGEALIRMTPRGYEVQLFHDGAPTQCLPYEGLEDLVYMLLLSAPAHIDVPAPQNADQRDTLASLRAVFAHHVRVQQTH